MKSKIKINRPDDLMPLINKYARKKQEHFGVIALNSQYEVIGQKCLFIGTDARCAVSSRILFWYLCKKEANTFIVFHNHPSGNTNPSSDDINITDTLKKCGDLMEIKLLDHVIVGRYNYYSFLENQCVFSTHDKEVKVAERS